MEGFSIIRAMRGDYPVTAVTGDCARHGEFPQRAFHSGGVEIGRMPLECPACVEARAAEEREQERLEHVRMLLQEARIPLRFAGADLANYDASDNPEAFAIVKDYAARWPAQTKTGESIILIGAVGTGKTHLAIALVKAAAHACTTARYCTVLELLREVRATWRKQSSRSETEIVGYFSGVSLLVLDEVGAQYATEGERVVLFDILNERYERMLPTVICGNATIEELERCLDQRSVDRMRENGGKAATFTGRSHRRDVA